MTPTTSSPPSPDAPEAPRVPHPLRTKAGPRQWLGLAVLLLPVALMTADLGVLWLATPYLTADLRPSSSQLLWTTDMYGFMTAGFLVIMGTLGDRIGRRKLLLAGSVGVIAASLLAAYAPDPQTLIAARALLGVAGAAVLPSTLALITHMFTDARQRATAIAMWVTALSVGIAIGPVVGGVLLDSFWWGSVFLLGVPVMVPVVLLAWPRRPAWWRSPWASRSSCSASPRSACSARRSPWARPRRRRQVRPRRPARPPTTSGWPSASPVPAASRWPSTATR
ncbi:MFS transporter [Streptomyces sp. Isolate_45]|nr:MFS transporter [Streptomyces sp. Isolate_45]MDA5284523.1 MFS transporter [Streptomyces sp. Isolate_45]